MKLRHLEMFLEAPEKVSFSEAALELCSSQSSVSNAVAELERELGHKLLERGRAGAEPTALGLRIARHVRGILQLTEAIGQEVSLEEAGISGALGARSK